MRHGVLMGFLIAKHAVVSHLADAGYSEARDPSCQSWRRWLTAHCSLELFITGFVLWCAWQVPGEWVARFLCMEATLLVGSALMERRAAWHRLILTHVLMEGWLLGVYATLQWMPA